MHHITSLLMGRGCSQVGIVEPLDREDLGLIPATVKLKKLTIAQKENKGAPGAMKSVGCF